MRFPYQKHIEISFGGHEHVSERSKCSQSLDNIVGALAPDNPATYPGVWARVTHYVTAPQALRSVLYVS